MNSLCIRKAKNGKGVFTKKAFGGREIVMEFHGKIFTYEELPIPYDEVGDHYAQVGKNLYMGSSGGLNDFINHSCDPNCGLVIKGKNKKVNLVAIRQIKKGEEITWDYSTTMAEDDWEMDCNCGSSNCRRRIRDFKYLSSEIQKKYIELRVVPRYLLENLKRHPVSKNNSINRISPLDI